MYQGMRSKLEQVISDINNKTGQGYKRVQVIRELLAELKEFDFLVKYIRNLPPKSDREEFQEHLKQDYKKLKRLLEKLKEKKIIEPMEDATAMQRLHYDMAYLFQT